MILSCEVIYAVALPQLKLKLSPLKCSPDKNAHPWLKEPHLLSERVRPTSFVRQGTKRMMSIHSMWPWKVTSTGALVGQSWVRDEELQKNGQGRHLVANSFGHGLVVSQEPQNLSAQKLRAPGAISLLDQSPGRHKSSWSC